MFLCSIIKVVCNEAVTANKVVNAALEKTQHEAWGGRRGLELCPGRYAGR